ncbi:MAG: DNA translocase FtsK 4TM domain-containing protein, partial [Brevundimonas sp.]
MSAALAIGTRVYDSARILWGAPIAVRFRGGFLAIVATLLLASLVSWNPADPSLNAAAAAAPTNWMGANGALFADLLYQSLGVAAWPAVLLMLAFGLSAALGEVVQTRLRPTPLKALAALLGVLLLAGALSALVIPAIWPLAAGLGGLWGDALLWAPASLLEFAGIPFAGALSGVLLAIAAVVLLAWTLGLRWKDLTETRVAHPARKGVRKARTAPRAAPAAAVRPRAAAPEPEVADEPVEASPPWEEPAAAAAPRAPRVAGVKTPRPSGREQTEMQGAFDFARAGGFELPPLGFLSKPKTRVAAVDEDALKQNAQMLE